MSRGASPLATGLSSPTEPEVAALRASIPSAEFTPGPWFWDDEGGWLNHETGMRDWCLIQGPECDEGGSIFEGGFVLEDDAKNLANARLIAAAPELYEALVEAERLLWEKGRKSNVITSAIAKVRGR